MTNHATVFPHPLTGRPTTFRELAEETGLDRSTLGLRYRNGDRGERLIRPPQKQFRTAKPTKVSEEERRFAAMRERLAEVSHHRRQKTPEWVLATCPRLGDYAKRLHA